MSDSITIILRDGEDLRTTRVRGSDVGTHIAAGDAFANEASVLASFQYRPDHSEYPSRLVVDGVVWSLDQECEDAAGEELVYTIDPIATDARAEAATAATAAYAVAIAAEA